MPRYEVFLRGLGWGCSPPREEEGGKKEGKGEKGTVGKVGAMFPLKKEGKDGVQWGGRKGKKKKEKGRPSKSADESGGEEPMVLSCGIFPLGVDSKAKKGQ